jgi:glycosyltransferase involved in cell wall biosynthesis
MNLAYIVRRYPRFSETFIVNEILAHEKSGENLNIFALEGPEDTHFQTLIGRVRAPVVFLPLGIPTLNEFWTAVEDLRGHKLAISRFLEGAREMPPHLVYQALALWRHITSRGITHLHAHFAANATTVARLAALLAGIPYSFTAHARDIFHEAVNPRELSLKICDASAVVTVSDYNLEYLAALAPTAADRMARIYYGVDLAQFTYIAPAKRAARIVAVGRLVEKKGFSVLLAACALLARRGCRFACDIIGTGPLESSLREQTKRLALTDTVHMHGALPHENIREIVRRAAVMVAPCIIASDGDRDGLPNVILEAMALGTPCIATRIVGISEAIVDGVSGMLVAERDQEGLASAIEILLSDSDLQATFASSARRLVEEKFDIAVNAARLRDVFKASGRAS